VLIGISLIARFLVYLLSKRRWSYPYKKTWNFLRFSYRRDYF
jgi:hypothetical protein